MTASREEQRLRRLRQAARVVLAAGAAVLLTGCAPDRAPDAGRGAGSEPSATYESPPVRLELMSDVDRVQPGATFRLGVLVTLEPGWYMPAPQPADHGQPNRIDLTLPYDFRAGPVRWPRPDRIARSGGVRYGYTTQLLLTSGVQASNVDADVDWPFRADVSLEACATDCVTARAALTLLLPHSVSGTRLEHFANERLFDQWEDRRPDRRGAVP